MNFAGELSPDDPPQGGGSDAAALFFGGSQSELESVVRRMERKNLAVDWQFRDSVRARMRILIRQLLRKYKYPPEGQEAAIALVLQQAEALADDWTGS